MKKKILASIVAGTFICQSLCTPTAFSDNKEPVQTLDGYVLTDGFDNSEIAFKNTAIKLDYETVLDENGESFLKVVNNGSGAATNERAYLIYPDVEMSPDENIIAVSVDVMMEEKDYYGQIVVQSSGSTRVIYAITADGQICANLNYAIKPQPGYPVVEYEPGEWNTLTTVINKERKLITFYLNGVGYGMIYYTGDWGDKITFRLDRQSQTVGVPNTMYIDNLTFGYEESICIAKDACGIEFVCEELGHTFFQKDVGFGVKVENNTEMEKTYDVTIEAVNDLKATDFSQTDTIELAPGEVKTIEYSTTLSRYAIHDINIRAVDKDSGETYEETTGITTMKKSEIQNQKVGICDHTALFRDGFERAEEKMEFFKNAGISAIRDMAQWVDWEKTPGVYSMPEHFEKVFDIAKSNNLDVFLINGMHNYLVAPGERPPQSKEAIEGFGRYTYNMVKDTMKYASGYEVYNEWNIKSFNTNGLPPEAYIPLIKEAYTQIKKANPQAEVYGLSGLSLSTNFDLDIFDMAEIMFENGVADYCDGFSIHPYWHTEGADGGTSVNAVKTIHDMMEKYGAADKPLILTEMGWRTTEATPKQIAPWIVKYEVLTYDMVDKIYWYTSQQKINQSETERSYGWMMDANEYADYVPYAPQEHFLSLANYNSRMANAELVGKVENPSQNTEMYRFKDKDGKDIIIAWVKDGFEKEDFAINLNTDTVEVEDIFGNSKDFKTKDGKLYITLEESPQYIIGNFGECTVETVECGLSADTINVVASDVGEFYVTKAEELSNVKIEMELPDNIEIVENQGFKNNKAKVRLKLGDYPKDNATIKVKVVDDNTGSIYYETNLLVTYANAVVVDIVPKMLSDERWQISLMMKNMKFENHISGEIKIAEPSFVSQNSGGFTFSNLAAQSTLTKNFYVPDYWNIARNNVRCEVILDNGETYNTDITVNLNGIVYTDTPPVIDGKLSEGEWDKRMRFVLDKASQLQRFEGWEGPEDLSAKLYFNWDKDNLYVGAEVKDNVLCDNPANAIWQNDSIQFALAPEKKNNGLRSEFGMGLSGGEVAFERSANMLINAAAVEGNTDDKDYGDTEVKITRSGNMTYYECKIPWSEAAYEGFNAGEYESLYISFIVNDNDGNGRRGWIEYCGGVGLNKNAINFERVKVFR